MTTLEQVRAKIIEAVPESGLCGSPCGCSTGPITLTDVLRAMQNKANETQCIGVDINGHFLDCDPNMTTFYILEPRWNLTLPLDEQEGDVIEFIGKVLGV